MKLVGPVLVTLTGALIYGFVSTRDVAYQTQNDVTHMTKNFDEFKEVLRQDLKNSAEKSTKTLTAHINERFNTLSTEIATMDRLHTLRLDRIDKDLEFARNNLGARLNEVNIIQKESKTTLSRLEKKLENNGLAIASLNQIAGQLQNKNGRFLAVPAIGKAISLDQLTKGASCAIVSTKPSSTTADGFRQIYIIPSIDFKSPGYVRFKSYEVPFDSQATGTPSPKSHSTFQSTVKKIATDLQEYPAYSISDLKKFAATDRPSIQIDSPRHIDITATFFLIDVPVESLHAKLAQLEGIKKKPDGTLEVVVGTLEVVVKNANDLMRLVSDEFESVLLAAQDGLLE